MGGIFSLTECASKNIRGESDPLNAGIAGCAAGLVAGLKSKYTRHTYGKRHGVETS